LNTETRIACNPISARSSEEDRKNGHDHHRCNTKDSKAPKAMTLATKAVASSQSVSMPPPDVKHKLQKPPICCLCMGSHTVVTCPQFLKMELQERKSTVKEKGMCWDA
jgi:hypothetical protein